MKWVSTCSSPCRRSPIPSRWGGTEVLTMRLLVVSCAPLVSSFTLSLACLLLTAISMHIKHDCEGPLPKLQSPTYCLSVSSCLSPVPHCSSSFCLTSPSPPVVDVLTCFSCWAPTCSSSCVASELCWKPTSRPSGDDAPGESLNRYLPLFPLISFFSKILLFDSVPSKSVRRALRSSSLTFYAGTPMFRKYLGSCGQQKPAGWRSPTPSLLPAPRCHQRRTTQPAYWRRTKAGSW